MIVEIINITDAPGRTPTQVDIYNKTIDPGVSLKLPAELVDKKVRSLEDQGLIAIGRVPPWYATAKQRKGKPLSSEERKRRQVSAPVRATTPTVVPLTPEPEVPSSSSKRAALKLELADTVPVTEELERKRQKR